MSYRFCPQCRESLIRNAEHQGNLHCPSASCQFVFWNNPVPVVAAIVEIDETVILVRNQGWPESMFGLVTGFLEKGESPDQAVVREVKEELGVTAILESFIGYYSFFPMNQLILAFHLRGSGKVILGEELADFKAVLINELKPWPFATGLAVKDWLARRQ